MTQKASNAESQCYGKAVKQTGSDRERASDRVELLSSTLDLGRPMRPKLYGKRPVSKLNSDTPSAYMSHFSGATLVPLWNSSGARYFEQPGRQVLTLAISLLETQSQWHAASLPPSHSHRLTDTISLSLSEPRHCLVISMSLSQPNVSLSQVSHQHAAAERLMRRWAPS